MAIAPSPPLIVFSSPDALKKGAGELALALEARGSFAGPVLITLRGPLGSGKTTFVQGFGEALGCDPKEIVSPSFTLANIYLGRVKIAHLDLWRLGEKGSPLAEFMEAGLDEFLDGAVLIEWPERLGDDFWPEDALQVVLREHPLRSDPQNNEGGTGRAAEFLGPFPESFIKSLAAVSQENSEA